MATAARTGTSSRPSPLNFISSDWSTYYLAGLRINPRTNGPAKAGQVVGLTLATLDGAKTPVALPAGVKIGTPKWAPDGKRFVVLGTTDRGIRSGNVILGDDAASLGNFTVGNASNTTFSGVISDAAFIPLTKTGTGALTLAGANTYRGTSTLSNGTLLVNGSLGTNAVTVVSGVLGGGERDEPVHADVEVLATMLLDAGCPSRR